MPSSVEKPAWNAMKSVRSASRRSGSRLAASARVGPYPLENVFHAASALGSR
jgi:hypothetical protein